MAQLYVNVNGTWKTASDYYVNVNGTWKTGSELHIKEGSTWKQSAQAFNPTTTLNITNSQNWTAPSGITQARITLTGGTFTNRWSPAGTTLSAAGRCAWTGNNPTNASLLAAFQSWESNVGPTLNSGAPGQRTVTSGGGNLTHSYTLNTGETVTVYGADGLLSYTAAAQSITIKGTWVVNPSTYVINWGAMGYGKHGQGAAYLNGLQLLQPAGTNAGGTASMFGLSAAGNVPGTSSNVTGPTIVSVTPGQTYYANMGFATNGYAYPLSQYSYGSAVLEY
ncbi:MAG: hypothetical protein CBE08_004495 [Euryarchaeota archaeon TMED248]|nr:MAG: hypothetical protein CBE08_004495 [Euryarchaeota archaeon TMED248]|tara:strand:+ start:1211 stop:2047 length:837 start_codon:yes stop_codon:yes gene_type:complete